MDPQLKSVLTSLGLSAAMAIAGWMVHAGIIPAADQSVLANQIVLIMAGAAAFGLAYYKAHSVSPKAMITAINAGDNGVKVVAADAPIQHVTEPLK